jgi:uncharacterized protein YjbI with pentapeptide repeats
MSSARSEIWAKLIAGERLSPADFPSVGGRIDLRGIVAPEPVKTGVTLSAGDSSLQGLSKVTKVQGAHWSGIDFSNARLGSVHIVDSEIENCVFDRSHCKRLVFGNTSVRRTSFHAADLRGAILGAVRDGKQNRFHDVDFSRGDFRRTGVGPAIMDRCDFSYAKLEHTEFSGTVLVDCKFAGELRDVIFYADLHGESFPPNEMRRADLRKATLHFTEFRRMDMQDVLWPEEEIVIDNYRETLDRVLAVLQQRNDVPARELAAVLGSNRKWAGANQQRGVVSKADLRECYGPDGVEFFLQLVRGKDAPT